MEANAHAIQDRIDGEVRDPATLEHPRMWRNRCAQHSASTPAAKILPKGPLESMRQSQKPPSSEKLEALRHGGIEVNKMAKKVASERTWIACPPQQQLPENQALQRHQTCDTQRDSALLTTRYTGQGTALG